MSTATYISILAAYMTTAATSAAAAYFTGIDHLYILTAAGIMSALLIIMIDLLDNTTPSNKR